MHPIEIEDGVIEKAEEASEPATNNYLVQTMRGRVDVWADYVRVEDGHLNFYIEPEGEETRRFLFWRYPVRVSYRRELVASYPPGEWGEFALVDDDVYGIIDPRTA